MSGVAVDRSRPPAAGEIRPFRFPPFERHPLPSGIELLVAPVAGASLVFLELLAPAGAIHDPLPLTGLASLTSALLDEGTGQRTALEIAAAVESLGGTLTTATGWDAAVVGVELQARQLDDGLGLVAEIATDPTFPGEELERVRRRRLAELLRRRDQPDTQAGLWLARALYGEGLRYGTSARGTEASLTRIGRDDVLSFYRRRYPPAGATLVAVGEVEIAGLLAAAEAAFGASAGGPPPPAATSQQPPAPRRRVILVDRPGGSQTELRVGQVGVSRRHPDFLRLKVMNSLLGGKFTSRLNLNLREQNGFTYGVYSSFASRLGPGPFSVAAAVATDVTGPAAREILGEIRRLRQEVVPREELASAQSYLVGTFPFGLQTVSGLANHLAELAVYDLPDDYYQRFPEEIQAVTPEEVLRVAREHLDPESMVLVAVGPAASLEPQLAPFGEVEVVEPL